jgi:CPA1 family monovalent cation:H+ antiporter
VTTVQVAALILSLTALLAYVNARWLRLPAQIAMIAFALAGSLVIVALDETGAIDAGRVEALVGQFNFGPTLVHGLLGLLLFAGALHIRLDDLSTQRWPIAALSLGGTLASTVIVGAAMYGLLHALGYPIPLIDTLVFGALISPTDPIAVLGVLKSSKVPRTLAVQISGESLFNDGIGVVVFTVLLAAAQGDHVGAGDIGLLFLREAIGGAGFGLVLGLLVVRMLRRISDANVEVLLTLGLVVGGYAAAEALHVSAPIAAVVSGICVGNRPATAAGDHLDLFWELIDEILNAVLFLALGLEATQLRVSLELAVGAAIAVGVVLAARLATVAASLALLRPFGRSEASAHAVAILTWGGLRGGLSVALALSLAPGAERDAILLLTYAIVSFAILVQGLTLPRLLRRLGLAD